MGDCENASRGAAVTVDDIATIARLTRVCTLDMRIHSYVCM